MSANVAPSRDVVGADGSAARWAVRPIWYFSISILAVLAVGVGAAALYVPDALRSSAVEAAYRGNLEIAEQIKITRGYYTQNVVAKALGSRALSVTDQHKEKNSSIPLPATFVKDISDLLKARATQLSLVSPYPWPHRADRTLDQFEQAAWTEFQTNPDAVFARQ